MNERLLQLINTVRSNKGMATLDTLDASARLRVDLGFDSFDLAELTVRVEAEWGFDLFADGLVETVGQVESAIGRVGRGRGAGGAAPRAVGP